jgi:predicted DNA-binding ribbon-helix-helix protein
MLNRISAKTGGARSYFRHGRRTAAKLEKNFRMRLSTIQVDQPAQTQTQTQTQATLRTLRDT